MKRRNNPKLYDDLRAKAASMEALPVEIGADGKLCAQPVESADTPEASAERRKRQFAQAEGRGALAPRSRFGVDPDALVQRLITGLVDSTEEIRAEVVKQLVSGDRQDCFQSVRVAVADLYERLSKAGK